ncbi:hypothetical protein HanRHA438_Chr02g0048221 [Helianthus annuus]|nr:hypothetical protein HanRHA438_Chr02g0048221 [Helianthus annuus]
MVRSIFVPRSSKYRPTCHRLLPHAPQGLILRTFFLQFFSLGKACLIRYVRVDSRLQSSCTSRFHGHIHSKVPSSVAITCLALLKQGYTRGPCDRSEWCIRYRPSNASNLNPKTTASTAGRDSCSPSCKSTT